MSNLWNYGHSWIPVKGNITIPGEGADAAAKQADGRNNEGILKNWAPFTDFISTINNTQIKNGKDLDVLIPSGRFWSYYRDDTND